jgi:predicted TIM-barrel fold metal-dependent hydrolase
MPTIDSDAHVVETEHTWEYMDPSDRKYAPVIMVPRDGDQDKDRYWVIDGKLKGRARAPLAAPGQGLLNRSATRKMETPQANREMEDIPGRLAHMDKLGIDIQVLYPSIFLGQVCESPEVEVAMCKSYNRWMADIWKQSDNRLRWAAMLPFQAGMDEAMKELPTVMETGACAVFMRSLEGDRLPSDPYFFPLYEEVSRLDMPIGVHIGNSNPVISEVFAGEVTGGGQFSRLRLMSIAGFHALIMNEVPDQFPKLRFGFLEATSQWIPFAMKDLIRRYDGRGKVLKDNVMRESRIWVSCQMDDDLPYVLGYSGDDSILAHTDYGHNDQSADIDALRTMRASEEISAVSVDKILWDNPKALYYNM